MPYSPIAEVYGSHGIPRGPNSYLSLGDSFSRGTVLPLPPGVVLAAPGTTAVHGELAARMAFMVGQGGAAGSRCIVDHSGKVCLPTTRMPRHAIHGLIRPAPGRTAYERAGATRRSPEVKGGPWRGLSGFTYAGDILSFDTASSGKRQAETWQAPAGTKVTKVELIDGYGAGLGSKAGTLTQAHMGSGGVVTHTDNSVTVSWGWKGNVRVVTGSTGGGTDPYAAPLAAMQNFVNGLMSGSVPADAAAPTSLPAAPAAGSPHQGTYDQLKVLFDDLSIAREAARLRQYQPPSWTPPSAVTPTTPSTPVVDTSIIPTYPGTTGGNVSTYVGGDPYMGSPGTTRVMAPSPTGTITPTTNDQGVIVSGPEGSSQQGAPSSGGKGGLVVALVAAAGLALYAYKRRRK